MTNTMPVNEMMQGLYNETLIGLAQGKTTQSAFESLLGKGVPEGNARMIVSEAEREKKAAFRQVGLREAGKGALMIVAGIAVTALTYALDMPIFFVAWGPVIYGGVRVVKGLKQAMVG